MRTAELDSHLIRLLDAVTTGNRGAFADFYDYTCGRVYGLVLHMIDDQRRSEEITRQTYAEVWETAYRYRVERGSPTAWVLLLAHRLAVTNMRSHHGESALPSEEDAAGTQESHTRENDVTCDDHATLESFWPTAQYRERKNLYRSYYRARTLRHIARTDDIPIEVVRASIKSALLAVHLHQCRTASTTVD